MNYQIGIVDDHHLVSHGLAMIISDFENFEVCFEMQDGTGLKQRMKTIQQLPDVILLDVNLPDVSGTELAEWISANYPDVKMVAVSMYDTDHAMRSMLRAGCCAYLLKGTSPQELKKALLAICENGAYQSSTQVNFRRLLLADDLYGGVTETELKFIHLACSDYSYAKIARLMGIASRSVETIRASVFKKLNVISRAGMVTVAFRKGLVLV